MNTYVDETKAKRLIDYLKRRGYVSYALALQKLGLEFTDEQGMIGYTTPRGVVINGTLHLGQQALVARHEVLHNLLGHLDPKTWGPDRNDHNLRNMAGDLELSHYYDESDSQHFNTGGAIADGLNVYRRRNKQYYGMDCLEIYDSLVEDGEAQGNSLGDCVQGEAEENGKPFDSACPPPVTQEEKDELLEKIKAEKQETYTRQQLQKQLRNAPQVDAETDLFYSLNRYFVHEQRMNRGKTYKRPNKKYGGSIIKKGVTRTQQPGKTLVVYVDRSGSMSDEKTGRAERILENTVKRLRNVSVITKYFSDEVSLDGNIGGGTNYAAVIDDINNHGYLDVAIVTDNDRDGGSNIATVDAVWLVSVDAGTRTTIADRFKATLMKETEVSRV